LDRKLVKYQEFVMDIINKKKEELSNDSEKSSQNLINAFLKSNEKTGNQKLTMDEIRVIKLYMYLLLNNTGLG
jgi:uncharacterized protein with gpF-like domain